MEPGKKLFHSKNGKLMHADLSAAYNIIREVFPDALVDGIRDVGLCPVGLSIQGMISQLEG